MIVFFATIFGFGRSLLITFVVLWLVIVIVLWIVNKSALTGEDDVK